MNRPIIRIHDLATDEIIDREMNDEEYKRHLEFSESVEKEKQLQQEREKKRQSALAKLAALGLTEEEIASL